MRLKDHKDPEQYGQHTPLSRTYTERRPHLLHSAAVQQYCTAVTPPPQMLGEGQHATPARACRAHNIIWERRAALFLERRGGHSRGGAQHAERAGALCIEGGINSRPGRGPGGGKPARYARRACQHRRRQKGLRLGSSRGPGGCRGGCGPEWGGRDDGIFERDVRRRGGEKRV